MCIECSDPEIFVAKRQLCRSCYHRKMRAIRKEKHPRSWRYKPTKRRKVIRNIIDKYGIGFIQDINKIRTSPCINLTVVANKYNLTRERIRQIYTILFKEPYRIKQSEKAELIRNSEIGCINDPRRRVADYKKSSVRHNRARIERRLFEISRQMGFKVEVPCKDAGGLVINGNRIKAKYCNHTMRTHKNYPDMVYHHYELSATEKKRFNYFALWHGKLNRFFIVPNTFKKNGRPVSVYIPIKLTERNVNNGCWQYMNNWNQLDG